MDYEQFFPKTEQPKCENEIRLTIVVMMILWAILDLTLMCKANYREKALKQENETLKNVILKSVDRALVRMMKNGNENEINHEE